MKADSPAEAQPLVLGVLGARARAGPGLGLLESPEEAHSASAPSAVPSLVGMN